MGTAALIAAERADHPDAIELVAELEAHLSERYPAESRHGYSVEKLLREGVAFFVARVAEHGVALLLRLETGIHQAGAIRLYEAYGFRRRPPFGSYREDPLSLYYEKAL